ncbi:Glycosyl transferase family 2 [Catalinimonas alkaloidigena]|uniref:Glycosyl transferase family 2 n=1 Tax=Catalinimonas alkaloidigena TaxID=1075417 RepID=A0A1G9N1P6_9BACT|nr:glycosyltransferase [Catalinimonas alkaloidigena]SDL80428.1 Glycosyl transferase family 2 [Catalinimonas alkaloidigena]
MEERDQSQRTASVAPLVTVVCLCHNHAPFVKEALRSVWAQSYAAIELIVVDDGSRDESVRVIEKELRDEPYAHFLHWKEGIGNCRAFNKALALSTGNYVIDLAADDVLLPDRVEKQVAAFEALDPNWGIVFSDAVLIDERSRVTGYQYARDKQGNLKKPVPQGDVYQALLGPFFLLSPTVMYRRDILEELGGYDETLHYEDFDILIRTARRYLFYYLDEPTTMKRRVKHSLSSRFYHRRRNDLLESTLRICEKVYAMNHTPDEHAALAYTVRYHLRQAFYTENFALVEGYFALLERTGHVDPLSRRLRQLARWRLPVWPLYRQYLRLRKQL